MCKSNFTKHTSKSEQKLTFLIRFWDIKVRVWKCLNCSNPNSEHLSMLSTRTVCRLRFVTTGPSTFSTQPSQNQACYSLSLSVSPSLSLSLSLSLPLSLWSSSRVDFNVGPRQLETLNFEICLATFGLRKHATGVPLWYFINRATIKCRCGLRGDCCWGGGAGTLDCSKCETAFPKCALRFISPTAWTFQKMQVFPSYCDLCWMFLWIIIYKQSSEPPRN